MEAFQGLLARDQTRRCTDHQKKERQKGNALEPGASSAHSRRDKHDAYSACHRPRHMLLFFLKCFSKRNRERSGPLAGFLFCVAVLPPSPLIWVGLLSALLLVVVLSLFQKQTKLSYFNIFVRFNHPHHEKRTNCTTQKGRKNTTPPKRRGGRQHQPKERERTKKKRRKKTALSIRRRRHATRGGENGSTT